MANGPFQTQEAAKFFFPFLKDELTPLCVKLQDFAIDVSTTQLGFLESFMPEKLTKLETGYVALSANFFNAYRKCFDPEEMFKLGDRTDPRSATALLHDHEQIKKIVRERFDEGFRLLAYVDRSISDRKTTVYNRVTMFVSLVALTVSAVAAIAAIGIHA